MLRICSSLQPCAGQQPTSTLLSPHNPSEQPYCPDLQCTWGASPVTRKTQKLHFQTPTSSASALLPSVVGKGPSPLVGQAFQGMRDPLAHQHPRLCKADMIMLIARKSFNALQRRESLLHSFSIVCVGASAGWSRPTCMQCCAFAADPSRLTPCRLRGIFKHRLRTAIGSSASSNCSIPGAHTPRV